MAARQTYTVLIDAETKGAVRGLNNMNTALKGFIGLVAAREIIDFGKNMLDNVKTFERLNNQLKLTTGSQKELNDTITKLTLTAQANRTGFEDTVDLYSKLAVSTEEMGVSQDRIINVTSKLSRALQLAGADAGTTSGVIRQFGQAMASGTVRGDEFNSLVEGLGPALTIMARETGINVGELRKLSQAGKLSAKVMFDMLEASTAIDDAFNQMSATTQSLETDFTDAFKIASAQFMESSGLADVYKDTLKSLTAVLDNLSGRASIHTATFEQLMDPKSPFTLQDRLERITLELNKAATANNYANGQLDDLVAQLEEYKASLEEQIRLETIANEKKAEQNAELADMRGLYDGIIADSEAYNKTLSNAAKTDYRTELEKQNDLIEAQQEAMNQLAEDIKEIIDTPGLAEVVSKELAAMQELMATSEQAFLNMKEVYKEMLDAEKQANAEAALGERLTRTRLMLATSTSQHYTEELQLLQQKLSIDKQIMQSELDAHTKAILFGRNEQRMVHEQMELEKQRRDKFIEAESVRRAEMLKTLQYQHMLKGKTAEQAKSLAEFEMKTDQEKAQWAIGQATDAFQALGQFNKQAFMAYKAFAIAQAIQNTYLGATKALASYPPPFNFIAAAGVVAGGLANVASIRGQTYAGRAGGGPVNKGQAYIVGEGGREMFVPDQNGTIMNQAQMGGMGGTVNVNFQIDATDAQTFDDLLITRKNLIVSMVRQAVGQGRLA